MRNDNGISQKTLLGVLHTAPALAVVCSVFCGASFADERAELSGRDFDCLIEPRVTSKVSAAVPGIISEVLVDRGDIVQAGQLIAKLEASVEEAAVEVARVRADNDMQTQSTLTRAEFLRKKSSRLEKLRPNNTVSEAAYDEAIAEAVVAEFNAREARSNLELARVELRRAKSQLNQRHVRSPVSGVVVERVLSPGEYRNEQSHILTIAQIDVLNVEVYVPITHFGQVRVGSRATVTPEDPVGGKYTATVTMLDRVLDSASGTFGVRLELPNSDYLLPGGLRCKIRFQTDASRPGPEAKK